MTVEIRRIAAADRDGWAPLYLGYGEFYGVPMDADTLATVWGWLMDDGHVLEGLLALQDGAPVGLAHYRAMPSPLRARAVGFLDDLFVAPAARGARIGEALFGRLSEIAAERGWPAMRWLTADDNYRARTLYDRIGRKTSWTLYELKP